jgi:outer membrane lipoprotein carrier protein
MKKSIFLAILVGLSLSVFAQYDPVALEILNAMSKKYKSITAFEANISYSLTNETSKLNEVKKGKITVKGDKYRLVLPELEVINDGKTTWNYLPDANEVNIDNFDPNSKDLNPAKIYEIYKTGFKYAHMGEEKEDAVSCDVIELIPEKRSAELGKIRMNISKSDKSIVSWMIFDHAGNRFKYKISQFKANVKVEDSFFSFDKKKYPGVEEIDLRY